jgi:hypothetical protein
MALETSPIEFIADVAGTEFLATGYSVGAVFVGGAVLVGGAALTYNFIRNRFKSSMQSM